MGMPNMANVGSAKLDRACGRYISEYGAAETEDVALPPPVAEIAQSRVGSWTKLLIAGITAIALNEFVHKGVWEMPLQYVIGK